MLIKIAKSSDAKEHQVTDEQIFHNRRKFMGFMGAGALLANAMACKQASAFSLFGDDPEPFKTKALEFSQNKHYQLSDTLTPEAKVTSYNNFYEFGTDKSDPKANAQGFNVDPWSLSIEGMVEKPYKLSYDELFTRFPLEERIYRMRCVEAWSMVIPWTGFSLAAMLAQAQPLSKAKYVAFDTLYDPKQMPGQNSRFMGGGIDYPYQEGLRLDEAMHPLTLMSVGLYGRTLPPQNGAPVRLVVPWKYGFKGIKSVVRIRLTDRKPATTWNKLAANEYGFYANVNPNVAHPRWSQARERRITSSELFNQDRIDTLMFNGYDEVASLYSDMDLRRYY